MLKEIESRLMDLRQKLASLVEENRALKDEIVLLKSIVEGSGESDGKRAA